LKTASWVIAAARLTRVGTSASRATVGPGEPEIAQCRE
jgi:hypothetical protein